MAVRFHSNHGEEVKLSADRTSAESLGKQAKTALFTERPLKPRETWTFKLEKGVNVFPSIMYNLSGMLYRIQQKANIKPHYAFYDHKKISYYL